MSFFVLDCSRTQMPLLASLSKPRNSITWPRFTPASAGRSSSHDLRFSLESPPKSADVFDDLPRSQHIETKPEQSVRYPSWEAAWLYGTLSSSHLKPRCIACWRAGEALARSWSRG